MIGTLTKDTPLVLVVDDDITTRMFAREQLEQDGFRVEEVADGSEAVEVFRRCRPDAVLLDVMMPGKNGFSICSELRMIPGAATAPIMMMTALEDEESIQRAYESGATEFTTKPVNWPIEVHRLRYMLRAAQAVNDVKQARDLWERTFNSIDDLVMIVDKDLRVQAANDSTRKAVRRNGAHLIGRTCYELFQKRSSPCEGCPLMQTLKDGAPHSSEMKYSELGASFLVSSSPIYDSEGNPSRMVYIAKDMSERKKTEEEFRHAQKMEAVGTLAGGISHDFNNLLQTILGNSQLLAMDMDESTEEYEDLQQVIHAANRGSELTRQLLTLSRKAQSQRKAVHLNDHIIQVTKLLARTLSKNIEIKSELPLDLPRISADPGQIEQVMMNLSVNAAHAMPDGGTLMMETREIELSDEGGQSHDGLPPGNYVLACVSDTGHGITKETLDHIFDPFFTTKAPGEGTGLGLSVSYGIMRTHEGRITCYSEVGMGTTFKLYFPALSPAQCPQTDLIEPSAAGVRGGTETILMVEDDPAIRQVAKKVLTRAGYQVIDAFDGVQALEVFDQREDQIDIVLLDIMMPNMGGIECLGELLKRDPTAKVLIASGYSPNLSRSQALEAGATEFVAKPYQAADMLSIIRRVLDRTDCLA